MRCYKNQRFRGIKCLILILVTLSLQICFYISLSLNEKDCDLDSPNDNILLWWTPFVKEDGRVINCDNVRCFLTGNREFKNDPGLKAVLFYGSLFNKSELPLNRNNELWGLFHEESPRNTPLLSHELILSLFNYSSTFSRFSDLPLTLQYLPSLDDITTKKYLISFEEKNNLEKYFGPVIYLQSDCVTPNNRDSYVFELMKYIKVDSYGECLNNKKIPESLTNSLETMMSEELIHFVSRYKFAIAFENAVCEDYITEKLWRPIMAGTIPIYFGSPSVRDWLPNNESAILPAEFDSPKALAKYLSYLASNSTAYDEHRKHKINQKIENKYLIKNFQKIIWNTSDDDDGDVTIIQKFECLICKKKNINKVSMVSKAHYNCPTPVSMLNRKYNFSNWWHTDYHVTKCEAASLRKFVDAAKLNKTTKGSEGFTYVYSNDENCAAIQEM